MVLASSCKVMTMLFSIKMHTVKSHLHYHAKRQGSDEGPRIHSEKGVWPYHLHFRNDISVNFTILALGNTGNVKPGCAFCTGVQFLKLPRVFISI